jgi:hypothetical protein
MFISPFGTRSSSWIDGLKPPISHKSVHAPSFSLVYTFCTIASTFQTSHLRHSNLTIVPMHTRPRHFPKLLHALPTMVRATVIPTMVCKISAEPEKTFLKYKTRAFVRSCLRPRTPVLSHRDVMTYLLYLLLLTSPHMCLHLHTAATISLISSRVGE